MILLELSLFFSCYHDVALFSLGTLNKSAKLQQKKKTNSRKTSMT